jgi:protein gp37
MSTLTGIEWTEATWNPVTGCTRVSAGCDHCYAVPMTRRLEGAARGAIGSGQLRAHGQKYVGLTVRNKRGDWHFNGTVRCHEDSLSIPLHWKKPKRIFVNSMSDLFHPDVPQTFIARVFAIMGLASWHTFQLLTKRPERMAQLLNSPTFAEFVDEYSTEHGVEADDCAQRFGYVDVLNRLTTDWRAQDHAALPMQNVWLGTSAEDQAAFDERVPHLRRCQAAVRFLSIEPLLGAIDTTPPQHRGTNWNIHDWLQDIDWVIVGGESGPGARPCNIEWIRTIRDRCAGRTDMGRPWPLPCFVKQLGALPMHRVRPPRGNDPRSGVEPFPIRDRKGGNPTEWPEDLRVRQFPAEVCHA